MSVTANSTSHYVNLSAVCRETPELWVVKNLSLCKFFRIISDLFSLEFEFG